MYFRWVYDPNIWFKLSLRWCNAPLNYSSPVLPPAARPVTCHSSSLSLSLSPPFGQSAWRRSEEEDERREKRASAVRAAERRLVQRARAELHGAPRGHPDAVTRVERQRLCGGCGPARGAPVSRLDGESLQCLLWKLLTLGHNVWPN